MSTVANTRWGIVSRVCGLGLIASFWNLAHLLFVLFYLDQFNDFHISTWIELFWLILLLTVHISSLSIFVWVLLNAPNLPFWLVPCSVVLAAIYLAISIYGESWIMCVVAGVLAFISFEMRYDLQGNKP